MISAIAKLCTTLALVLAVVDVSGWTPMVEKRLQRWKKIILRIANAMAPRGELPPAHRAACNKFWERIRPYHLAVSLAIWFGFTVFLMLLWYGVYHLEEATWGVFAALMAYFLVLGLVVGLALTFVALIVAAIAISIPIFILASLFRLLAIPRRGIVAALSLIVAGASWVFDIFLQ